VFIAAATEALLRDGHRVTLLLDLPESEFVRWTGIDSSTFEQRVCLRGWRVDDCCKDIDIGRDAFPSEAHWRSYRFAYALAKLHAETPVDLAEFFDYCGAAYYTLVTRAAEPTRFPSRIAVRLHNSIEIIDRRVASDFAPFRVYDYALERAALALADLVLSPGQRFWDKECASLYPAVNAERVQVSFPVRRAFPRVQGAGQGSDVVFVGRISTFKGADRVLHAAIAVLGDAALEQFVRRFVVIGPGETVSSSQTEGDILAIADGVPSERLLLAGRLAEADIRRHFGEAAVAIFPNRMESFCYAAHEAHMAGVPLILSDTPAFRDHFTEAESALFFDGTVGDLVDKLRLCLTDADMRSRLSASVELHRNRYLRHDYDRHLGAPPFAPSLSPMEPIGIVVVPLNQGETASRQTVEELASVLPAATIWQLVPATGTGTKIRAFGQLWQVLDQAGHQVSAATQILPSAVAFVAAGTSGVGAFLAEGARMLGNEPRIGAVFPARANSDGMRRISPAPATLEREENLSSGIISAVLRIAGRATLADLLEDGSELTELAALLRLRAMGGTLVDHPILGLLDGVMPRRLSMTALRPRLLRQFAWSNDRVLLADELADLAMVSTRLRAVDLPGFGQDQDQGPMPVSNDVFVLHVGGETGSGSKPNRATVLALRRIPGGPPVDLAEVRLSGRWRRASLIDRPQGMLVGEGGRLELAGVSNPGVTLLLGPDQGVAVLALGGRAIRLDLSDSNWRQLSVHMSDLFVLCRSVTDIEPSLSGNLLVHGIAVELTAALARGTRHLAVLETLADRTLAEAMRAIDTNKQDEYVLHANVRIDFASLGRAIASIATANDLHSITLFGGSALLPMIDQLLRHWPSAAVTYTLRPILTWQSGGWEWLRATAELAARYPGRLRLRAAAGAAMETLRTLGAPIDCASVTVPVPAFRPPPGPISLILPNDSTSIPGCGHIAAAAVEAVRTEMVSAVYLPSGHKHVLRILERFGVTQRIGFYDDTETLLSVMAGSRFIYCCPFADASVDAAALRVFGFGGLALVAPGPLVFASRQAQHTLVVAHWEDSMHIVKHLHEAIEQYDSLLESFCGEAVRLV
jgi:glycosyltransferase involved in cell wall biosynthesis